jgi:ribosome biogenesis GTPase
MPPIVAGDTVRVTALPGAHLRIDAVEPRRSVLGRFVGKTDTRSTFDPIAANIDLVVLVCSPTSPPFRPGLIDRYLTAAALESLPFAICLNKSDLGVTAEVESMLAGYASTGVAIFTTSAQTGDGIDLLRSSLEKKISLFTGHSGVGKSSLLNAIEPGLALKTGSVTQATAGDGKGRHTTTSARLIPLSLPDTYVVDSPGVRGFGLGPIAADDLLVGFPEIVDASQRCRIRRCRHNAEAGCAVETELSKTPFGTHRLASYRSLAGFAPPEPDLD